MHGIPNYIPPVSWFNARLAEGGAQVRLISRDHDRENPDPLQQWTSRLEEKATQEDLDNADRHMAQMMDRHAHEMATGGVIRTRVRTDLGTITHVFRRTDGMAVWWCRGPLDIYWMFRRHWSAWVGHRLAYPIMPKKMPYSEVPAERDELGFVTRPTSPATEPPPAPVQG